MMLNVSEIILRNPTTQICSQLPNETILEIVLSNYSMASFVFVSITAAKNGSGWCPLNAGGVSTLCWWMVARKITVRQNELAECLFAFISVGNSEVKTRRLLGVFSIVLY